MVSIACALDVFCLIHSCGMLSYVIMMYWMLCILDVFFLVYLEVLNLYSDDIGVNYRFLPHECFKPKDFDLTFITCYIV